MTILDYQEKLQSHHPCEEGEESFLRCRSRKEVFECLAHPKHADFLLQSMKEGWGPTPSDIESIFRPYINGAYTVNLKLSNDRSAKSQVWCNADNIVVDDDVRAIVVIGCNAEIVVNNWQVLKILVDHRSRVEIVASPNSVVFVESYGGKVIDEGHYCKIRYAE